MSLAVGELHLNPIPEPLVEAAQSIQGLWRIGDREIQVDYAGIEENQCRFISSEGDEVSFPVSVLANYPTEEKLSSRISKVRQESKHIQRIANTCLTGVVLAYSAHKILTITGGIPFFVDIILSSVSAFGYPLSDSIYGYKSSKDLRELQDISDIEGQKLERAKITETILSFIGGTLFAASELASLLKAHFLSGILSLSMLPFYAVACIVSMTMKSYNIHQSVKFKNQMKVAMEKGESEAEKLQNGLEYLKQLLHPSEEKITEMLQEIMQQDLSDADKQKIINETLKEYENEKITQLNALERKIGSKALNDLIHQLNNALEDVKNGKVEKASILLNTVQQQTNQQIKAAILSMIISFVVLALFITLTILTEGATLALIV